jgi:hypothetical protein
MRDQWSSNGFGQFAIDELEPAPGYVANHRSGRVREKLGFRPVRHTLSPSTGAALVVAELTRDDPRRNRS